MQEKVVYRIDDNINRQDVLCTTYQMRNFYTQFKDGFFTNLDVMNYIQHYAVAKMAKKRYECCRCMLRAFINVTIIKILC